MKLIRLLTLLLALAAPAALVAGCGDDEKSDEKSEETSTPQQAIAEIGEVRKLLAQVVVKIREGDRAAAEKLAGDAYLEHFEKVEGPLGEKDHELMEEIEEQIATELRDEIKSGASTAQIAALVAKIQVGLVKAEALLRT
jgi:hypothetical protein